MTIIEMIQQKKASGLTNQMIADRSGVPLATVQKIFGGSTTSPRYETKAALEKAFAKEKRSGGVSYLTSEKTTGMLKDAAVAYSVIHADKGEKTIEDYLALPEGVRVELIDGKFYDMAAPNVRHQHIGGMIYHMLMNHIMAKKGPCIPMIAPTDVQLDADDKTMVQPDVMIICDKSKITSMRVMGAPDMIVEVVSPGNWYVDVNIKMKKYKIAGVREYWMVIPETETVLVYHFERGDEPKEYTFADKVPVAVWDDRFEVDFSLIKDQLDGIFG